MQYVNQFEHVYLYQYYSDTLVGNIYALGNPMFFWSGVVAVVSLLILLSTRQIKKSNIGIMIFAYIAFFVPWALSPRIMFVYHYLPSLPFLAIILAYFLKKNTWLAGPVLFFTTLLFIYFYPHWTGLHIPEHLAQTYYWFDSWR